MRRLTVKNATRRLPIGSACLLAYDAFNKGEFYWETHGFSGEGEDMRIIGRFRYAGDDWSAVGDYLYAFEGDICRGSGAEPCSIVGAVVPSPDYTA